MFGKTMGKPYQLYSNMLGLQAEEGQTCLNNIMAVFRNVCTFRSPSPLINLIVQLYQIQGQNVLIFLKWS